MSLLFKDRLRKVSLIFACGTALLSDGYANGVLSEVNTLLNRIYGAENVDANGYGTTVRSVAFAGTIVGMLIFGYLSDKVGRKFGMMAATGIVALFSGLSAASKGAHGSLDGLLSMLSAMRFLLGIGVGAEYPCGSVSASEQSEQEGIHKRAQHRWLALATDTMINFGFVIAAFVPLVLLWICGENNLHVVWRLSLGLGVVPALFVFFWRLNMEEPERFRKDSMKYAKIPYSLVIKKYWVSLATISFIWFLYDFVVYPFGIYSSTILDNVTGGTDSLTVIFGWNVVIKYFVLYAWFVVVSSSHFNPMPKIGAILGTFIVDYLGPKYTLILGLVAQGIVGFIMSGLYKQLTKHIAAFVVVYGIFLALGELGPGICTIILASKSSPTAVRGQFYSVAAAVGKIGAFAGTWAFPPMIDAFGGASSVRGNTGPFWFSSGLAFLSAIVALLFLPPVNTDGMIKLDQEFREYLEENGYDTSQMGLPDAQRASVP